MRYIKWAIIAVFWLLVISVLHYTLPQRDIARVTDTYERRIDPGSNGMFWSGPDAGSDATVVNRDVFFISSTRQNGKAMVYRNEDTGWGWPPYFKFDTTTLQAEAANLKSTDSDPQWVIVRHYGWRMELITIFPNVLSVKPIDDPNMRLIPWFNIIFLTLLFAVFWAIRVRWIRFREARIDPTLEAVEDRYDDSRSWVARVTGRK